MGIPGKHKQGGVVALLDATTHEVHVLILEQFIQGWMQVGHRTLVPSSYVPSMQEQSETEGLVTWEQVKQLSCVPEQVLHL